MTASGKAESEAGHADSTRPLSELAALISAGHAERVKAARAELEQAVEVGRILSGVRDRFPDGGWPEWVERTARSDPAGRGLHPDLSPSGIGPPPAGLDPAQSRSRVMVSRDASGVAVPFPFPTVCDSAGAIADYCGGEGEQAAVLDSTAAPPLDSGSLAVATAHQTRCRPRAPPRGRRRSQTHVPAKTPRAGPGGRGPCRRRHGRVRRRHLAALSAGRILRHLPAGSRSNPSMARSRSS